MKKDILVELEKELEVKGKDYFTLRDKVNGIKEKRILPSIRKAYEGRYFKFMNSSGGDKKWPIYSYCVKILDGRNAIAHSFETSPVESTFKIGEHFFHTFQTEISKKEFYSALKVFKEKVNSIGKWL